MYFFLENKLFKCATLYRSLKAAKKTALNVAHKISIAFSG